MDSQTHFLVIDDSYIDRLVSGLLLKRTFSAAEVSDASSGEEALALLRSRPANQNRMVILLDIMMPKMNGFEFLHHFEQLEESLVQNATVIMLSSTLDETDINRARQHPLVKVLLSKPLSVQEVKQYV